MRSIAATELGLLALLLCACQGVEKGGLLATAPPTYGGMEVELEGDLLLISSGGQERMAIPLAELAFRRASATYDDMFGAFYIVEEADSWQQADSHGIDQQDVDGLLIRLDSGGAALGELELEPMGEGHLRLHLRPADPELNRSRLRWRCDADDHFQGLGAQQLDVDHRGTDSFTFVSEPGIGKYSTNDYGSDWMIKGQRSAAGASIPALVTSRATALAIDSRQYIGWDFCAADQERVEVEVWESELRLDLYAGDDILEARRRMTAHLGRPRLPPPWAFAPWNDGLYGPEAVLELADFLRAEQIPSSAIWAEDWRGGADSGYGYRIAPNWTVDESLYPDLPGMTAALAAQGLQFQAYDNPHFIEGADIYEEATEAGHAVMDASTGQALNVQGADGTFSPTAFLDLTDEAAREWAIGLLTQALDLGVRGWMADFGEWTPIEGAAVESGEDMVAAHNATPLRWQELNNEAIARAGLEGEVAVYFRSAHQGSQGSATILWAGDQRTSFDADDGLPSIIPMGLGLAAAGVPFYTHDIAGYQFLGNEPTTRELLYRWTQLGAFSTVMRTHHGIKAEENWDLRSDEESTALWRRYAELHVRLYPYLRGLALRASRDGDPVWMPMSWPHPQEEDLWSVEDQFWLGPALVVAPVVTAAEEGAEATLRTLRLGPGRYVPWLEGGTAIEGPAQVELEVPLTEVPVYIAEGGLVPLTARPAQTLLDGVEGMEDLASTRGDRVLYVGLGASGRFEEEDGATYMLSGSGTHLGDLPESVELQGDGRLEGEGFVLELSGHPAERRTTVLFR
jgi:alpha-glucosidase (family GH31 glycosyl hydrolase)